MEPFTTNFSEKCAASNFWPEIILKVEAACMSKAQVCTGLYDATSQRRQSSEPHTFREDLL